MPKHSPLLDFLVDRKQLELLDLQGWSLLFAEARACGLMARLATELIDELPESMPTGLRAQALSAIRQSEALARDVRRELHHVEVALKTLDTRKVLLKGAAYIAAGLPAASGRIFSDIDVLVDKELIGRAEAALMLGGWVAHHSSDYDRRYYREWSHEIPPMVHMQRATVIDLHHSLVMPTCRIRIDVRPMLEEVVAIPGPGNWFRLGDEDMVLHAASHLLLNAEFDRGLRDLWDIDILLRHFGAMQHDFPERVLDRAKAVGLAEIASTAFILCSLRFGTVLPCFDLSVRSVLLRLIETATSTRHPTTRSRLQILADGLLSSREMYLRLPWHLLVRHLLHKTGEAMKLLRTQEVK